MEELLLEDKQNFDQVIAMVSDENKQRDLITEDEEEDFLDEGDYSKIFITIINYFCYQKEV